MLLRSGLAGLAWVLACAPVCAAQAAAAARPDPDDVLEQRWYYTEVVIFQRPALLEYLSDEALVISDPGPFPAELRGLVPAGDFLAAGFEQDPTPRMCFGEALEQRFEARDDEPLPDPGMAARMDLPSDDPEPADTQAPGEPPPEIRPRLAADPKLDALAALAAFESELAERSYRWLDRETLELADAARRLATSGTYQVLLHGRWLQPLPARNAPEPLLIQAGPRLGDHHQLEGVLEVTAARYLHFRARLLLSEPLLGRAPVSAPVPPPGLAAARSEPLLPLTAAGYVELDQSRRVRADEVHYFDHPKLGMLVRIEPVTLPDGLVSALAALEERTQ